MNDSITLVCAVVGTASGVISAVLAWLTYAKSHNETSVPAIPKKESSYSTLDVAKGVLRETTTAKPTTDVVTSRERSKNVRLLMTITCLFSYVSLVMILIVYLGAGIVGSIIGAIILLLCVKMTLYIVSVFYRAK
jgi:hypothetical protein